MSYSTDKTERNQQVLALLLQGCTLKEVAAQLYLSVATVKRSASEIYLAQGVHRRRELLDKCNRGSRA